MFKKKIIVFYLILGVACSQSVINAGEFAMGQEPKDHQSIPFWRTFVIHSLVFIQPLWFKPRIPFELHYGNEVKKIDWYRQFRPHLDYPQATVFLHSWFAGQYLVSLALQNYFCDRRSINENLGLSKLPDSIVYIRKDMHITRTSCVE